MNVIQSSTSETKSFIDAEDDFLKITTKDIWFPSHISEIDGCQQLPQTSNHDVNSTYPGFTDPVYIKRRKKITSIAQNYKIGDVIPCVEYTKQEKQTWKFVYASLKNSHKSFACAEYLRSFKMLEEKGLYSPDSIPQFQDVSAFMADQTGFQLHPTAGLLTPRDFLASLAFKVFQCTQYVRHHSSPMHTPEPDCCHELLGHVPMFCDPNFATFSQEVGLASLGATDKDIEKLSTLYWFTVEFGLCKEADGLKAYGAGLLSSFGELEHAVSDVPEHFPLVAEEAAVQIYDDNHYQPIYFVANSFEEAIQEVRAYSMKGIKRNFCVKYVENERKIIKIPKIHQGQ